MDRRYRKHNEKMMKFFAFILACIIAFSPVNAELVQASINDNTGNNAIAQAIGSWGDSGETHTLFGILQLIIDKINTQLEKLESLETKVDALDTKMDLQTVSIRESIENMGQAANASYNLYVYIPKSITQSNYSGQQVIITSASGNQNATATLRDDGTNYSTTLYFNFSGSCKLNFSIISASDTCAVELPVTISATGQEQQLWKKGQYSDKYPMSFVHDVCAANRATEFFEAGNNLSCGWTIANFGTDDEGNQALQLWRKTNLGNAVWSSANSTATSYWNTFNSSNSTTVAYKSGLLSKTEVESGWLASNRTTGFHYWLETLYSSGRHWLVDTDGNVGYSGDSYSIGCAPAVWIH